MNEKQFIWYSWFLSLVLEIEGPKKFWEVRLTEPRSFIHESLRDPRSKWRRLVGYAALHAAVFPSWSLSPHHAVVTFSRPNGPQLRVSCEICSLSGFLRPKSDPIPRSLHLHAPRCWSQLCSQIWPAKHGSNSVTSNPVYPQPFPCAHLPGFCHHPIPGPPSVPPPVPLLWEHMPGPGVLHLLQPVQQCLPLSQDASVQTHILPGVPGAHQRQVGPAQHHPVPSLPRGHDVAGARAAHAGHRRGRVDLPASCDAESLQRPLPAQQRETTGQKVRLFSVKFNYPPQEEKQSFPLSSQDLLQVCEDGIGGQPALLTSGFPAHPREMVAHRAAWARLWSG